MHAPVRPPRHATTLDLHSTTTNTNSTTNSTTNANAPAVPPRSRMNNSWRRSLPSPTNSSSNLTFNANDSHHFIEAQHDSNDTNTDTSNNAHNSSARNLRKMFESQTTTSTQGSSPGIIRRGTIGPTNGHKITQEHNRTFAPVNNVSQSSSLRLNKPPPIPARRPNIASVFPSTSPPSSNEIDNASPPVSTSASFADSGQNGSGEYATNTARIATQPPPQMRLRMASSESELPVRTSNNAPPISPRSKMPGATLRTMNSFDQLPSVNRASRPLVSPRNSGGTNPSLPPLPRKPTSPTASAYNSSGEINVRATVSPRGVTSPTSPSASLISEPPASAPPPFSPPPVPHHAVVAQLESSMAAASPASSTIVEANPTVTCSTRPVIPPLSLRPVGHPIGSTNTNNSPRAAIGAPTPSPKRPSASSTPRDTYSYVLEELITTETDYVIDLAVIGGVWMYELRDRKLMNEDEILIVFSNVLQLQRLNSQLLEALKTLAKLPVEQHDYSAIVSFLEFLKSLYAQYCTNFSNAIEKLQQLQSQNSTLAAALEDLRKRPECKLLDLPSFLIKPMQRITKYPLLLQELLKALPDTHPYYASLQNCYDRLSAVVLEINDKQGIAENLNKMCSIQAMFDTEIISPHRRFVKEKMFGRVVINNKDTIKRCWLFVFNDTMLFAKKPNKAGRKFVCKSNLIPLASISIWNSADDKSNEFTITRTDHAASDRYLVVAESQAEKHEWLSTLEELVAPHHARSTAGSLPAVMMGGSLTPRGELSRSVPSAGTHMPSAQV